MKDTVYYEYIQNDRVQYFIHCAMAKVSSTYVTGAFLGRGR